MDDPDDFFAGLEDDEPPPSPFKGFSHLVPYGPVFNSVDREREASILASVHTTQGKILERRASNATPPSSQRAPLPLFQVGGLASSSIGPLPMNSAYAPTTLAIAEIAIPSIVTPPRRILKRQHSALTDQDVLDICLVPKRRRLRCKTPAGPEWPTVPRPEEDTFRQAASTEAELSTEYPLPITTGTLDSNSDILCDAIISEALSALGADILEFKLINRMACRTLLRGGVVKHCRDLLLHKISKGELAAGSTGLSWGKRLQWGASQYLTKMTPPQKCRLYRSLIEDLRRDGKGDQLSNFLCHIYRQEKKTLDEDDGRGSWLKSKVTILTYQGAWGIIPWTGQLRGCKEDLKKLCAILGKLPQVQDLLVDLMSLCTDARSEYDLKDIHCSIELCITTLEDDDLLRAHCHICMEAKYGKLIRIKHASRVVFRNSWPVKQSGENDCIQTRNASAGASCAYYLRMPKVGMIMSWGTKKPNAGFRVNPDWIMAYVQAGKISPEDARMEISKTWKNCKMLIENIDWNLQFLRKVQLQATVKSRQQRISASRGSRKFRKEIDEVWLPEMAIEDDRHRVLVLGGRSRTGKTTCCKLMASPEGYLEINCKGLTVQPNLRPVNHLTELINFDEASVKWCLDNRKILQGPEIPVTMGDSNTGMLAYDVLLNGIKMVVCSNTWSEELAKVQCAMDQDYIEKNFLFVDCNELMYELPIF